MSSASYSSDDDDVSQEAADMYDEVMGTLIQNVTADEVVDIAQRVYACKDVPFMCVDWLESLSPVYMSCNELEKLVKYSEEDDTLKASALHALFDNVRKGLYESITVTGVLPIHKRLFSTDKLIYKVLERIRGFPPSSHLLDSLVAIHYDRD